MTVLVPRSLDEACAAYATHPDATVLAGGTDLMVDVNRGRHRPETVVALRRVADLAGWRSSDAGWWLGAGLTYTEMLAPELAAGLPVLAQAARTVGSPQIRNAGTLGGNLATASPAGDTLPGLLALDAVVHVRAEEGRRAVPIHDFFMGVKHTQLGAGEIIEGVFVPAVEGPQEYLKVGVRNAMVIAVASVALVVDRAARQVRVGVGAAAPTPIRAPEAEAWVAGEIDWAVGRAPDGVAATFGAMVAEAVSPIDDHRSTADYRRHSVSVMAERALARAL